MISKEEERTREMGGGTRVKELNNTKRERKGGTTGREVEE